MLPLPVGQLRRVRAGPGHEDGAVHRGRGRHRQRGQREGIRQHHGDPRIAAGHLVLAAHPHQPPLPYRLGDRDRRAQPHPLPGRREGPGQPRHHRHLQHRFVGRPADTPRRSGRGRRPSSTASASDSSGRPTGAGAARRRLARTSARRTRRPPPRTGASRRGSLSRPGPQGISPCTAGPARRASPRAGTRVPARRRERPRTPSAPAPCPLSRSARRRTGALVCAPAHPDGRFFAPEGGRGTPNNGARVHATRNQADGELRGRAVIRVLLVHDACLVQIGPGGVAAPGTRPRGVRHPVAQRARPAASRYGPTSARPTWTARTRTASRRWASYRCASRTGVRRAFSCWPAPTGRGC